MNQNDPINPLHPRVSPPEPDPGKESSPPRPDEKTSGEALPSQGTRQRSTQSNDSQRDVATGERKFWLRISLLPIITAFATLTAIRVDHGTAPADLAHSNSPLPMYQPDAAAVPLPTAKAATVPADAQAKELDAALVDFGTDASDQTR
jgi:hypothetical protein